MAYFSDLLDTINEKTFLVHVPNSGRLESVMKISTLELEKRGLWKMVEQLTDR